MKKLLTLFFLTLFTQLVCAQTNWEVSGVVTDAEDGLPLPGVTVSIQGLMQGTVTDIDGHFSLSVPQGKSVEFSYIGYKTQTVVIKNNAVLTIEMSVDSRMLDEVVAIGYGSIKKSDLTGAVGSVSGDKLRAAPVAKLDQALQGRMAGVTVNSNSGQPGADATIRIRGVGSLNASAPVYVVDGLITDNINFLSTSDIASLEVLKDASAQAIYGARGANGVILITTKKGSNTGKTNLTFESYLGTQNRWKSLDIMKRDEMANTIAILGRTKGELDKIGLNEWIRSNYTPNNSTYYPRIVEYNTDSSVKTPGIDYTLYDTNWQDEIFRKDAMIQNYYFSADGGSEKTNYMFSANYFDQEGTLIGSMYNRLTLRLNTSFQVRNWLRIGENLSFTTSHNRNVQGNGNTALIASAISMAPWDPVIYPEGSLSGYPNRNPEQQRDLSGRYSTPSLFRNVTHPYNQVYHTDPYNNNEDWVGDVFLEITPVKGLVLRGDISMKLWNGIERTYTPLLPSSDVTYGSIDKNGVSAWMTRSNQLTYEGTATYNTVIANKHAITILAGATTEEYNYYRINAGGSELINTDSRNWYVGQTPDEIRYNDSGTPYSTRSGSDSVDKTRMVSLLGRIHYVFDNKYLFTSNFRRDGSSKLPPNAKFDIFPSAAVAWKINEEDFFTPLENKIDFLKLRLGWGRIGSVNSLSSSSEAEVVRSSTWMVGYPLGNPNMVTNGMSSTGIPPLTHWEFTEQTDLGIDFGLFNSLLIGNIDLFRRDTHDMLMNIQPPGHVGYRFNPMGNAATVRNQGVEFSLEHIHKIGDFAYSVAGNISFIHNKLMKLNGAEPLWDGIILSDQYLPLNTIYVFQYDGVFQNQAAIDAHQWLNPETGLLQPIQPDVKPGDARYKDINNDGRITDLDRKNSGNPFPSITYGFNASVNYKGFDLQLFFQGISGNEVYNYLNQNKLQSDGTAGGLSTEMRNVFYAVQEDPNDPNSSWINGMPGSNGSIPNPSAFGNPHNKDASTRFVEDASYLRLKNIQLGYTIPKQLTERLGIERLRFYVGGSNLLTFTQYKGFDPEVGDNGRDWGNFPQARTLLFGLNMNF
ncbi:MAG: TonB-dependent receptor [Candidatus Symbiothrix sp.]|jgi:TonB-linked SusC/RagA family outer membrane protein|nr:TonB-dependent receptor [Candidatus Symbiothrix sp.]